MKQANQTTSPTLHEFQRQPQWTGTLNTPVPSQHSSPPNLCLFPNEIWTEIFGWYATSWCTFRPTAPSASAWVLRHVCRQWRDLALSIPQLWNHLPIVHVTLESLEGDHFRECWEEFLLRSGSLLLKLHLSFEIPVETLLERPCKVLAPFFHHVGRWEHLTISGLTVMQAQVQLDKVCSHLPLLLCHIQFCRNYFRFLPEPLFRHL